MKNKGVLYALLLAALMIALPVSTATARRSKVVKGGVLNQKAVKLAVPDYPAIARNVRPKPEGEVWVEIRVDESGNVVSAAAVKGHDLLKAVCVTAARQAKFTPSTINGEAVQVEGVIIFTFKAPAS